MQVKSPAWCLADSETVRMCTCPHALSHTRRRTTHRTHTSHGFLSHPHTSLSPAPSPQQRQPPWHQQPQLPLGTSEEAKLLVPPGRWLYAAGCPSLPESPSLCHPEQDLPGNKLGRNKVPRVHFSKVSEVRPSGEAWTATTSLGWTLTSEGVTAGVPPNTPNPEWETNGEQG